MDDLDLAAGLVFDRALDAAEARAAATVTVEILDDETGPWAQARPGWGALSLWQSGGVIVSWATTPDGERGVVRPSIQASATDVVGAVCDVVAAHGEGPTRAQLEEALTACREALARHLDSADEEVPC